MVRNLISEFETRLDAVSRDFFGTDGFARTANIANDLSHRARKGFSDRMGKQLEFYNMPSRDDITALGERIMEVEDRLIRIEDMLLKALPASADASRSGPPRTKKPATKVKAKTAKKAAPKSSPKANQVRK